MRHLTLNLRPSAVLLPVPVIKRGFFLLIRLLMDIALYRHEMCLIFVPTKKLAKKLSHVLRAPYITSETKDKQECLDAFRQDRGILIATTVLERGVTFIDCFVFVYQANHITFTESSLVQIAGRALRGMTPKKGMVIFYCLEINAAIKNALQRIETANDGARCVLKKYSETRV